MILQCAWMQYESYFHHICLAFKAKKKKSHRNRQMINSHTNRPFNFVPATLCPELSIIYSLTYLLKSIPIYRFTSGSNVFSYSFLIMCACFLCIISSSWISPKSPIKIDGILMVPRYWWCPEPSILNSFRQSISTPESSLYQRRMLLWLQSPQCHYLRSFYLGFAGQKSFGMQHHKPER